MTRTSSEGARSSSVAARYVSQGGGELITPTLKRSVVGRGDAAPILTWAETAIADDNRYLKLRRIAIERLATIL